MPEMNKNEDRAQAPKSRPRPEVKRPIIPPPGGLPMPPSRQHGVPLPRSETFPSSQSQQQNVTQSGILSLPPSQQQITQQPTGLPMPPSSQQSVPSSSGSLPESRSTTSNIPTPGTLLRPSENPPLSGTVPIDLFGLPDFRFPIPSTSKSGFGFFETGFSSIKSPTHLPKLANIKVPNLFGSHAARSGIAGSSLPSAIQSPRPPNIRPSRDQITRDLPGMNASSASTAEDLPKRAKRPTRLPLTNVTSTNLSSDPDPNDIPGTSSKSLPNSKTSKESQTTRTSDGAPESNLPSIPTSHMREPSAAESNSDSRNVPGTSAVSLPSTSASIHLPGPSSNAASSEPHNPQVKLDVKRSSDPTPVGVPGPSGIRRTGDSMPSNTQGPDGDGSKRFAKSKLMYGKFKRYVKKRLSVKKASGGPEDKEESTGLVFERDEDQQEPRPQPRPQEPEKKYKHFTTKEYNHLLDKDPVLPNKEVEEKCYVSANIKVDSPTVSVISDASTSKSEPEQASIDNPASQAPEELISISNPTPPATEQNSASETSERVSTSIPTPGISESASASNPINEISESTSASNPITENSESSSNTKAETP